MFSNKYTATLLDSKWNPIKNNVKFNVIPRKNEYLYYTDKYYHVVNVVHDMTDKHKVLIVIEDISNDKNQEMGSTK